ncbi:hypothetical protein JXM83_03420 [Candidatus Woesearchaeota archaeon]|nr:hypothetical protein [Candidatus Woesearchaeota archaeon]
MRTKVLNKLSEVLPKGKLGKTLLLTLGLLSAGKAFAQDVDYADFLQKLNSNPAVVEYAVNRNVSADRAQLGEGVELIGATLADKLGYDYTLDGTFDTTYDLPKLKDFENQLSTEFPDLAQYVRSTTIVPEEILAVKNIAVSHLEDKLSIPPVLQQDPVAGSVVAVDDSRVYDKWQTIVSAKNIGEISDVIGRGMGSLGYIELARRAPISAEQFEIAVQNIYASAIYTTLEDAQKGLIPLDTAIQSFSQAGLQYLNTHGYNLVPSTTTSLVKAVPETAYTLEEMLDIALPSLLNLANKVYAGTTNVEAKSQLEMLRTVNRIHNASTYMNSKFGIDSQYIIPVGVVPVTFSLNDVSNGSFYGNFDQVTNFPNLEITLLDLFKVGAEFGPQKTGSVSFAETGADAQPIEGYAINQGNFSLYGMFNVLGFLPESNKVNGNLWLGLAYNNMTYSQDFNGVEIPRSRTTEDGIGLRIAGDLDFNIAGNLLSLAGYFSTGLNTFPEQIGLFGGGSLDYKYFFNGGYLGLGGDLFADNEPTTPAIGGRGRITGGIQAGPGFITLDAGYGTDGLSARLGYKF